MKLPGLSDKQKEMIAFGEAHPYSLLCADPRLGKSRAAIELQKKRKVSCLVVCPSYLVLNWRKEILKWSPKSLVTIFKSGKEIYEIVDSDFAVISYDLAKKAEHLFEWADMVVADEVHNLKNTAATRSQFFHRAIYENSVKYFHGLTGTPIKNRVREFYSLMALAHYDPRLDGRNIPKNEQFLELFPDEISFAEYFSYSKSFTMEVLSGKKKRQITVTNYTGIRNVPVLKKYLKNCYIRIRADKNDLPPISYLDTLVSDIADKKLLEDFENYFISDQEAYSYRNPFAVRKKRTSSVLPEHKRNAAVKKVPFTIKYVENLMESVDCCLVYSDHKEPCQLIAKHFKVPAITGEMSATKRSQLVNDFQNGKLNVLCATIGSLKEGSDLYRAKDLVMNDVCWVPGDIQQVVNRMRALGEKEPRTVHRIFGSPQDEIIWKALNEKIVTIDKAT